eukprot:1752867-Rhodomonas_salina.2
MQTSFRRIAQFNRADLPCSACAGRGCRLLIEDDALPCLAFPSDPMTVFVPTAFRASSSVAALPIDLQRARVARCIRKRAPFTTGVANSVFATCSARAIEPIFVTCPVVHDVPPPPASTWHTHPPGRSSPPKRSASPSSRARKRHLGGTPCMMLLVQSDLSWHFPQVPLASASHTSFAPQVVSTVQMHRCPLAPSVGVSSGHDGTSVATP